MESYLNALIDLSTVHALALSAVVLGTLAGLVVHLLVLRAMRTAAERDPSPVRAAFLRHCRRPLAWAIPLLGASLAVSVAAPADPGAPVWEILARILSLALIVAFAWFVVGLTGVGTTAYLARFDTAARDNLDARKAHTQMGLVRKIAIVFIAFVALAAIFMSFEALRELGTGLLASAGVAGIVVGLAAQRTLGNVLAGFQIAITQPIRLDDVVIVEGEWGRIEEITLTYVVVRIWDERRLVVPISHFIEKPFQNWTRTSADILGAVHLQLDYRIPVEEVRREVGRLVEGNEHWDGRLWRLHVTEAGTGTLELRALMSAADSASAWELRCAVREGLVDWVQRNHPSSLPRFRAEVGRISGEADEGEAGNPWAA